MSFLGSLELLLYVFVSVIGFISYKHYKKLLTNKRKASLRNKVVVITGASSGIGESLAHEFFDQGCKVVLAARRTEELARVKRDLMSKKLPQESPEPVVIKLDLGNLDECQDFVKKVLGECGHVDILVNNGGQAHTGSNLKTKFEIHKQIIYVNYFGTVVISNGFLQSMRERKSGHIVIVSSVLGRMSLPFRAPYCASKHALIAYGDALRAEVKKFNIDVTVLIPGFVRTDISVNSVTATGEKYGRLEDGAEDGYTPEYAAQKFLDIIVNREKEAYLCQPLLAFSIALRQVWPSLFFYLMTKRA